MMIDHDTTIYIVAEYTKHDGMRPRGVELERAKACQLAANLWAREGRHTDDPADYVVEAWKPGQFELNSRGERDHVIFSCNAEYRPNEERTWTPPKQQLLSI